MDERRESDKEALVVDFVASYFGAGAVVNEVRILKGDASDRNYYRVGLNALREGTPDSVVVMLLSEPYQDGEPPFMNIAEFLRGLGVGVPKVYVYQPTDGLLALEDCGDLTLLDAWETESTPQMEGFYFRAVEDLVTMQTGGGGRQRAACHAYAYSFDEERFLWELNFTMEHWLNGLMGIALPAEDADVVQELFRDMARAMLDQDLCFTHRDYHSRNLMVLGEQLRVLDFQDARLGPPQYDLASLLRDSYVTLPPGWEELLLDYYFRIMEWEGKTPGDIEEFMRVYEIACLQRNLKAIGTFASQKTLRGNDHYLEYIPPTLSRIKENRAAREKFYPLIEILASHVPGW